MERGGAQGGAGETGGIIGVAQETAHGEIIRGLSIFLDFFQKPWYNTSIIKQEEKHGTGELDTGGRAHL